MKEHADACRKHGLKVGLYYSPMDWGFGRQYKSWSRGKGGLRDMDHKLLEKKEDFPRAPRDHGKKRLEMVRGQISELLTNYGKIDLMWFDGGHAEMSNKEVRELQPGIVINRRNQDPDDPGDYGDTEGSCVTERPPDRWMESCICIWPVGAWNWMHEGIQPGADLPLAAFSVTRALGINVLANVGPKGDGSLHENTIAAWKDMADWMEHSAESVHDVRPGPWPDGKANLPVTTRGDDVSYVHFLPKFPERFPNIPKWMKNKFNSPASIIGKIPYETTFTWEDVAKPKKVTLLRTGEDVECQWENKTLTITLPDSLRTKLVDVVKLQW